MSYGGAVSTNTMFKGEFAQATYPPLQNCAALDEYSIMFHLQSMNLFPSAAVGTELQKRGLRSVVLQSGRRPNRSDTSGDQRNFGSGRAVVGGAHYVQFGVRSCNAGASGDVGSSSRTAAQLGRLPIPLQSLDLRTLQSFSSETFQFALTLSAPLQRGTVSVALLIPDSAPSLSSSPAYALPLNSLDENNDPIFDRTTGYNFILGSGPLLGPSFKLDAAGSVTSNPNEVVEGAYSIKGSHTGTKTFIPYLETVPSVLPLAPRYPYKVSFRYKILTSPSNGMEVLFFSPSAAAQGNFLPSVTITGAAGTTGTTTLTNTLGPYTDYRALWTIPSTGAISIDDIQIIDATSGKVIAATNAESILTSPMRIVP